jgi:hypothetical protein
MTAKKDTLSLYPYRVARRNAVYYVERKIFKLFWVRERPTFPSLESALNYIDDIRPIAKDKFEYWY